MLGIQNRFNVLDGMIVSAQGHNLVLNTWGDFSWVWTRGVMMKKLGRLVRLNGLMKLTSDFVEIIERPAELFGSVFCW